MSLAFVFPGQGSQKVGMGASLLSERPELFDRYLSLADEVSALPIRSLCLEGPIEELTRTDVAQPALFAVGLAVAEAAREVGLEPDFVAGHSLGEYTAAVVAGALGAQDGMRIVSERGRLMAAIQSERPGSMAAIIGLGRAQVEQLCAEAGEAGVVSVANLNSPTQIVVSGEQAGVARLVELAPEAGARKAVPLQVGAAFHSELMVPVQERLRETIEAVPFSDARTPLVAVCSGEALQGADEIRAALLAQIVSPVRWVEVVETLADAGCDSFLELGPGRVLIGLIRQIRPEVAMTAADSVQKLTDYAAAAGT
jgi:[acyl-carrier-protein] S-malonyltransferase